MRYDTVLMRRKNRAIDEQEALDLLTNAKGGRIGMIDPQGKPYIVPVNFILVDDSIYVHTANEGKKIDSLRAHADVCFEIDEERGLIAGEKACDYSQKYASVMCFGRAELVEEEDKKIAALHALMNKYETQRDFSDDMMPFENVAIVRIVIDTFSGKHRDDR